MTKKINLQSISTVAPKSLNKKKVLQENAEMITKIHAHQYKMFAE